MAAAKTSIIITINEGHNYEKQQNKQTSQHWLVIILLHTSKTMRPAASDGVDLQLPELLDHAKKLDIHLKKLSVKTIADMMKISPKLAAITHQLVANWTADPLQQRAAIDSFLGDIYSGLQVHDWSPGDRDYANQHLRILSGLYGVLRPLDGIYPYRFEMGYRLPGLAAKNMYQYWSDTVASALQPDRLIINLAAVEYSKVVTEYVSPERIITPQFLTISPKTGQPTFVVVHAKIARGAFARWLIVNRISDLKKLQDFKDLQYEYSNDASTPTEPVFVCKTFGGIGLSVRLNKA